VIIFRMGRLWDAAVFIGLFLILLARLPTLLFTFPDVFLLMEVSKVTLCFIGKIIYIRYNY
jgi:hypothetical protein